MIANHNFNLHAFGGCAEVLDGFFNGPYATFAGDIRIEAGLIIEHANLDGWALVLRGGWANSQGKKACQAGGGVDEISTHSFNSNCRPLRPGTTGWPVIWVDAGHMRLGLRPRGIRVVSACWLRDRRP